MCFWVAIQLLVAYPSMLRVIVLHPRILRHDGDIVLPRRTLDQKRRVIWKRPIRLDDVA